MPVSINSYAKEFFQRQRAIPVVALVSLFLLFVQSADLVHSHDGDLQPQYDCEICLKAGSGGDAIVASKTHIDIPTPRQSYLQIQLSPEFAPLLSPNSRSPPTA